MLLGHDRQPTTPETLDIMTWGTDNTVLKDFINTAIKHCMEKDNDTIGIYELHRWGLGWIKAQAKKPRPMSSVVLDKDLSE
jgi:hypothetical protein